MEFTIKTNVKPTKSTNGVVASVSFIISDMIYMTGFVLRQGKNGLFLCPPSWKDKEGNYKNYIFGKKEVMNRLTELAITEFDSRSNASTNAETGEKLPF